MKLLATFNAGDVDPDAPHFDYASFKSRAAARAIVFDGDRVALIHVKEHDYYMLPGGGLDDKEDIRAGLNREITEELGCKIEIVGEVGSAEIYFDRWSKKQTDYCYTTHKVSETNKALTDFEIDEGHNVIWVDNLQKAIEVVEAATPVNRDGKMVRARDLLFLKTSRELDN